MDKYYPFRFIRFSENCLLQKITSLFFFLAILFSFSSASAQWIAKTPPSFLERQYGIYFINENTGWISTNEGNVSKTTNGGNNWTTYNVAAGLFKITFINENTGFLGGNGGGYKSTNGGVNWTLTSLPLNRSEAFFANELTGWFVGSGNPAIHKTTNGGNNWFVVLNGFATLNDVTFINENTGWTAGDNGNIYKTTDAGNNWLQQSTGSNDHFNAVSFADENTGYLVASPEKIYKTTNGGSNWTLSMVSAVTMSDVYFINNLTGWIGGSIIYFTSDGGTNWIVQSTNPVRIFTKTSYQYIYAGSIMSSVYKTTTGGFNLTPPSDLTLTPVSTSQINLSWTDNSDEDKFMIERKPGSGSWQLIDSVNSGVTSYQSTGLATGSEYSYRVYPKKLIWTGGYSNEPVAFTLMETPVNQSPANSSVITTDTTTFRWTHAGTSIACTLQVSTDIFFSNIIYQADAIGFNINSILIPPGILQNSRYYYWRVMVRNFSTYSDFSIPTLFVCQNPNYGHNISSAHNLYYFANSTPGADLSPSKPTYNWRDTTGSTNLILNGVLQIPVSAGNIDDGRFDLLNILTPGNSIRFFGTDYQNVYVGTNSIVGFTTFNPQGTGRYEPTSALPQANITNAIFPLWKDLNFGDSDVPLNRLCYKVTSDEIIITYMRAPNYTTGSDIGDYVSFQVIIKHSSSPAANSKIEVMYNYDQTGSSFITKYNANTLLSNLIGLQAANSALQIFQYRYLNGSQQLITTGPMFGSNLALAMGPDVNALPVELASFTSSVNANNIQLNWSTVTEENNSGFEVERRELSVVNGEWKKVGSVQGSGTTSETKNYSYEDRNVQSGSYKYRLKQIDYNGNFEYHELAGEVIIGIPTKYALSQNYPNPFNPVTKINFEIPKSVNGQLSGTPWVNVKLIVYDVTGRMIAELVNKQMEAGYYTIDFNASNLSSGIYFYRLAANDFVQTKKMVLMK